MTARPLSAPDALSDALRDDLAEARRENRILCEMFRAALDQLALVATVPEQYAVLQRELRQERERFIAGEIRTAQERELTPCP